MEGIGIFASETLSRIARLHPEHKFILIFDRSYHGSFITSDNIFPVVAGPQTRHPLLWYHWLKFVLPSVLKKHKADIFLSPDGFMPINRLPIPCVNVIHDLNFEYYPNDLPLLTRKFYKKYFPRFAENCSRLVTVSEFSKKTIVSNYHIPEEKIDVVYNGVQESFKVVDERTKEEVRQRYTTGLDYFLYVGSLHPRKNIPRLLQAYENYRKSGGNRKKLLIVGQKMSWSNDDHEIAKMKFGGDVLFTGYLSTTELASVTASAYALVYVPYFEGFGIPLIEAMRCGVPIITSNRTSMPEVAGEAAILADPFSVHSICDALLRISRDDSLHKDLSSKGLIRSQHFTWEKSAAALWKSIEKALE